MRDDGLSRTLDERRWPAPIARQPARDLRRQGLARVSGKEVATRYGVLGHYVSGSMLPVYIAQGVIGGPNGTWLTPTSYAACMAPYNLGLNTPRDFCMLVDVTEFDELWGPGTADKSTLHPTIWQGGGIEFFVPRAIPLHLVREVVRLSPCGDTH